MKGINQYALGKSGKTQWLKQFLKIRRQNKVEKSERMQMKYLDE